MSAYAPASKGPYKKSPVRKRKAAARRGFFLAGMALFVVFMAVLGFVFTKAHNAALRSAAFKAREIRVTGARFLSRRQVLDQAGIREGANVLAVNLSLARKRLLANPWIVDAQVKRHLPAGLEIGIRERAALAALDVGPGFLLDEDGRVFKRLEASDPPDLVRVKGLAFSDMDPAPESGPAAFAEAIRALKVFGREKRLFAPGTLKEIRVDRELGLELAISGDGKKTGAGAAKRIRIGYGSYGEKRKALERVARHMKSHGGFSKYSFLDLSAPERAVVRPVGRGIKKQ
ncbi:putative Cell division protein FtsQ [Candidatus Desulfarcum epimagneticum]|uniref:Putative Cell division protein FtsQ n=1 Tax=uncultured Desulfobacteraceae bacterium TaxID=218296 RepID=A0A484HJ37_9BACT|nr:putative Cell division protein FtsQ [uncultured Desulfobacteraceae bacterium]